MIQSVNLVIQTRKMRDYKWNDSVYSQTLTRVLGNANTNDGGGDGKMNESKKERKKGGKKTYHSPPAINSYRNRTEWNDMRFYFAKFTHIHRSCYTIAQVDDGRLNWTWQRNWTQSSRRGRSFFFFFVQLTLLGWLWEHQSTSCTLYMNKLLINTVHVNIYYFSYYYST